tara:strand:- start:289 stop:426 length:138 start_codon:yes stop_codon:yes gene_type:complete
MIYLQATEKDYLKATKQTAGKRGKGTTTGAKYLNAEKYRETREEK